MIASLPSGGVAAATLGGASTRKFADAPVGRLSLLVTPPPEVTGLLLVDSVLAGNWEALQSAAWQLVLPVAVLTIGALAPIARMARSSMLEVLESAYIRAARSLGLPWRSVVWKYALKNACIPTITLLGLGIGRLLGNAVLVEIVFARPGLGRLIYNAISERNYPIVQGAALVVVVLFVVVNLIVDLSYTAIDPRIRQGAAGGPTR